MKAIILIPGVQFPMLVVEHAFEYAKETEADLHTIFLMSKEMDHEHELVNGFRRTLEKRAGASHIKMAVDFMDPAEIVEVMNVCREADRVFLDPQSIEQVSIIGRSLLKQGFLTA